MDYKVFYRKYRPKNFNELVGQDSIKDVLINSIKLKKLAHAYIFTGPRGTGKTSTAKIFAKTLNCLNNNSGISCDDCEMCKTYVDSADIIEIDAASNNGVDEIRTLRDSVKIAPYSSKYKVYIIDEVHMLSNSAWNALLKTLEEPPGHVLFILATTEINKIPETVMSRCQRFDFSKIPTNLMFEHLKNICINENMNITDDALQEIVKLSNGCLRDALSFLDKISKFEGTINISLIEDNFGILSSTKLNDLYIYIYNNDKSKVNSKLEEISNSGITPMNFINEFVEYLLNKIINNEYENYNEMNNIKELIYKLNSIILNFNSVVNPFTLIKVELITTNYFPGNKNVDISRDYEINNKDYIEKKVENVNKKSKVDVEFVNNTNINVDNNIFNTEKVMQEEIKEHTNNNLGIDYLKKIRINNSFVNPAKELKIEFMNLWKSLLDKMNIENEFNILGYVENGNIEVVSTTNVIFSFKSMSDSIIFNKNLLSIENKYNEEYNKTYKFIGLSQEEWNVEKQQFINNKNKKYEYIDEEKQEIKEDIKTKDIAEDIFGEDIIEIK